MKCPKCEGRKTLAITVSEFGSKKPPQTLDIKCIYCEGRGEVTLAQAASIKAGDEMWCVCKKPGEPTYYADGQHPEVRKHHYRCGKCDKVTQIG